MLAASSVLAASMRRRGIFIVAIFVAACGSDDTAHTPVDAGIPLEPREYALESLMHDLFVPTCSSGRCHTRGIEFGGLILDANVIENTVGVVSTGAPPRIRVVAGDPQASYLIEKIESDSPAAGLRMPPTGNLPARDIARIRAWISALEP